MQFINNSFLIGHDIIIENICAGAPKLIQSEPPCVRAFMDDLFLKSATLNGAQDLLNQANTALSWRRMAFKPAKTRCLVLTDGKFQEDVGLYVSKSNIDVSISSISNLPVKFLGRTILYIVSDKDQMEVISSAVSNALDLISPYKSLDRGVQEDWILQHLLVPWLRWPLLIHEIPISVVLGLEQKISSYIQKWLKLHNSTTNICLYSSILLFPLPIKSLTSVMKSAKVSSHLFLCESSDHVSLEEAFI